MPNKRLSKARAEAFYAGLYHLCHEPVYQSDRWHLSELSDGRLVGFAIQTRYGILEIHVYREDLIPVCGRAIFMRFVEAEKRPTNAGLSDGGPYNTHSGKWNIHPPDDQLDDDVENDKVSGADRHILCHKNSASYLVTQRYVTTFSVR